MPTPQDDDAAQASDARADVRAEARNEERRVTHAKVQADEEDHSFARFARYWMLFTVPGYILLALGVIAGFYIDRADTKDQIQRIKEEEQERSRSDRAILVARTVATCDERNVTKDTLRGVIDAAVGNGEGGVASLDFSRVPGFNALDPETQNFFSNIGMLLASNPSTSSDRLLTFRAGLVNEDCVALGEALAEDLEKQDGVLHQDDGA